MNRKPYTKEDFSWTQWKSEDLEREAQAATEKTKENLDRLVAMASSDRTFDNTVWAFEVAFLPMYGTMNKIDFLVNVSPDKAIRDAGQTVVDKMQADVVEFAFREDVYEAVKAYADKKESLTGDALRLFEDTMRDYKRAGFELAPEVRQKVKANTQEMQLLQNEFQKRLNESQDSITVSPEEAKGLSEQFLKTLKRDEAGNYIVTTAYPDYFPFVEDAEKWEKRKELIDKFFKRGGDENIELLRKVLVLRAENAKLLGYENHAAFVLEEKMAKDPKTVMDFLHGLIEGLKPLVKQDIAEIAKVKAAHMGSDEPIKYYDVSFYSNMLRKQRYNFDKEEVKKYFPLHVVLEKMMQLYSELLSVTFEKLEGYPLWHEGVALYLVRDADGTALSYFALDLHPRDGKYGHAAEFAVITAHQASIGTNDYIMPLAVMVANFPVAAEGSPSLMSHEEVETLFHEFGHVMHENLGQQRFYLQSGTHVARDFAEAPSQMLENWLWDRDMLKRISSHYETGEPLPDELLEKMLAAKHHFDGHFYMRQLTLGLFDMKLHIEDHTNDIVELYNRIVDELIGIGLLPDHRFPAGFGHLVGGYDAGYYGYLWSKVYSSDMFTRFAKEGLLNKQTGLDYRHKILEVGSSRDEMESLVDFLGRQPNNEAFLKEIGVS